MECYPLFDKKFLIFSYADESTTRNCAHPELGCAWVDSALDALNEESILDYLSPLASPHVLIRRISSKLDDPRYKPAQFTTSLFKKMTTYVASDRVLKNTAIYPLFSNLADLANEPYSGYTAELASRIKAQFESGMYLRAIIAQTKIDVASGAPLAAVRNLGRVLAAELLCLGYNDREAQMLVLRAFDPIEPRGRTTDYPSPKQKNPTFDMRLDALLMELFGPEKKYLHVFSIFGADLHGQMTVDGCRFYRPSRDSLFPSLPDGKSGEELHGDNEDSVHVEVVVSASNAPQARRRARKKIEEVLDRLQNLHPVHRSPVSIGSICIQAEIDRTSGKELIEPHHFVHGVHWSKDVEERYMRFYESLDDCPIRHLLDVIWSHAKRARDSSSSVEKFLSYWTILERIYDEADMLNVQPPSKGGVLTEGMANFLASPLLLNLPYSVSMYLFSRIVFAAFPPYEGPFPVPRSRLRFRGSSIRKRLRRGSSLRAFVRSLPQLKQSCLSPSIADLVDQTERFFQFDRHTVSVFDQVRANLAETLSVVYQIRNSIVHDAYVDDVLFAPALEQLESLSNMWLDVLTSVAMRGTYRRASDVLLSQYIMAETLESKLKCRQITSLDEWPVGIADVWLHRRRSPQFDYSDPVII